MYIYICVYIYMRLYIYIYIYATVSTVIHSKVAKRADFKYPHHTKEMIIM